MFKNYLKVALRNIFRNKFYSLINILGLSIGLVCFIIIGMWVKDELSYDRQFKNANRIYRIDNDMFTSGVPSAMACADPRIAEHIRASYPEIENITRVLNVSSLLSYNDKEFFEPNAYYADSTFFDIFSYEFVKGDPKTALMTKQAIVITEKMAKKIFGDSDALGKTIKISNIKTHNTTVPMTVTGVIKDNNQRAHLNPEVIMSKFRYMEMFETTYALFAKGYDPKRFENKVWPELNKNYFIEEYIHDKQSLTAHLMPLLKIHLYSNLLGELEPNGSIVNVYIFSVIAFFILLIAAINYMNLATARSFNRSREVGIRKVLGATRKQLIVQFLTESVALSLLALVLALALAEITLPFFNKLSGKNLTMNLLDPFTLITIVLLALFVGFISGIYPAFFVSSFLPVKALTGTIETSKSKLTLRKGLVILQFSLSIIMLICTMVVSKQLAYVKKENLGFNKDQILVVNIEDPKVKGQTEAFKTELLKSPDIVGAAASHNVPGSEMYHFYYQFETPAGMEPRLITAMTVDYDYLKLMGVAFAAGIDFDKSMLSQLDTTIFVVLNNAAVKSLNWNEPVGMKVYTSPLFGLRKGKCIGVVKDFHVASLHDEIPPMIFGLGRKGYNFLSIKIHPNNIPATISYIEGLWKTFSQGYPFDYNFLDDSFNKQYQKDEHMNVLFKWFSGLCIFISCLGLMGLASFSIKQRTKEICIRKISGANVSDIVFILSKDFMKLVFIALVVAAPIAWYAMNKWLQSFAYRTPIGWVIFVVAGLLAGIIALLTISFHTIRAANRNPASVLKYE